jgi:hypothetical protein
MSEDISKEHPLNSVELGKLECGCVTPSTVCDEDDKTFPMPTADLTCPDSLISEQHRSQQFRIPGSVSSIYVRGPFSFPMITSSINSGRPICMICQKEFRTGHNCRELRRCGHCFHASCLESHLESHSRCPVCRVRCKPPSTKDRRKKTTGSRTYWTPDYDSQLMLISDKIDREKRTRQYLLKGTRDHPPRSYVFLKCSLPTLLEESEESIKQDDGTLLSLCKSISREREIQKLRDIRNWTNDMRRLAITFMFSIINLYIEQSMFVKTMLKRQ